ncbi:hypothetical protein EK904_007578 [Melospiza melodia maxima]|nr:hypothetical protein EK904_007578 [Melospiza melodia maxima]
MKHHLPVLCSTLHPRDTWIYTSGNGVWPLNSLTQSSTTWQHHTCVVPRNRSKIIQKLQHYGITPPQMCVLSVKKNLYFFNLDGKSSSGNGANPESSASLSRRGGIEYTRLPFQWINGKV